MKIKAKNKNKNINKIDIGDGDDFSGSCSGKKGKKGKKSQDPKLCRLYLPFEDGVAKDESGYETPVYLDGTYTLENDTAKAAHGRGSLYLNHGKLAIPDLKIFRCGKPTSMCFWFKCENCEHGTIFSNREDKKCSSEASKDFSLTVEVIKNRHDPGQKFEKSGVRIRAGFKHQKPVIADFFPERAGIPYVHKMASDGMPFGFAQYCVLYDGHNITIVNNGNWKSKTLHKKGRLVKNKNPSVFGVDSVGGSFAGWLDEVLVCDRVLTPYEIMSHYAGRLAMESVGLVPAIPNPPYYERISPNTPVNILNGCDNCGQSWFWNNYGGSDIAPFPQPLGIVGGREIKDYEFPWVVLFQVSKQYYHCHGSLIDDRHVVTSGVCCRSLQRDSSPEAFLGVRHTGYTQNLRAQNPRAPDNLFNDPSDFTQKRFISSIKLHPDFNDAIYEQYMNSTTNNRTRQERYFRAENNICVVELDSYVDLSGWEVQPVCLPDCGCRIDRCDVGELGEMVGFGQQSYSKFKNFTIPIQL